MENNIDITLNVGELKDVLKESLVSSINKSLNKNKENIENSLDNYFRKGFFNDRDSQFENALDWAVESVFREGITKAIEELSFKELIANKAKEILSDNEFIRNLAERKVRASLGLNNL